MWFHYSCGPTHIVLFSLFSSQKQPARDTLGDMWSPETPGYNQTQEPQYPDSATTTTDSCSDSELSKEHLAAIYSNDLLYNEHLGPLRFPADFLKGGATSVNTMMTWKQHIHRTMCFGNNRQIEPGFSVYES